MRERPPDTYHSPENTLMECPKAAPPQCASPRKPLLFPESCFSGAGEGNRTPDPLITNQMLYRLSYASRWKQVQPSTILPRSLREVRDNYLSYHKGISRATGSPAQILTKSRCASSRSLQTKPPSGPGAIISRLTFCSQRMSRVPAEIDAHSTPPPHPSARVAACGRRSVDRDPAQALSAGSGPPAPGRGRFPLHQSEVDSDIQRHRSAAAGFARTGVPEVCRGDGLSI